MSGTLSEVATAIGNLAVYATPSFLAGNATAVAHDSSTPFEALVRVELSSDFTGATLSPSQSPSVRRHRIRVSTPAFALAMRLGMRSVAAA